jgi:hypothetical protein
MAILCSARSENILVNEKALTYLNNGKIKIVPAFLQLFVMGVQPGDTIYSTKAMTTVALNCGCAALIPT